MLVGLGQSGPNPCNGLTASGSLGAASAPFDCKVAIIIMDGSRFVTHPGKINYLTLEICFNFK